MSFVTVHRNSHPKIDLPAADERITRTKIARISSMTSIPTTSSAKGLDFNLSSAKDLMMIVVEEIESMAPKNKPSVDDQPAILPANNPKPIIKTTSTQATIPEEIPTFLIRRKL